MPPKSKSKTPPLTKNNRNRVNTLSTLRINTKSGNQLSLPPEIISLIAKQLKKIQPEKYLPEYIIGVNYFYDYRYEIMNDVNYHAYRYARLQGDYHRLMDEIPNEWIGSLSRRPLIGLRKMYLMFPKLSVSKKVKDAVISVNNCSPRPDHWLAPQKVISLNQISFLQNILNCRVRNDLNNYISLDGFIDALFEQLRADIKKQEEAYKRKMGNKYTPFCPNTWNGVVAPWRRKTPTHHGK